MRSVPSPPDLAVLFGIGDKRILDEYRLVSLGRFIFGFSCMEDKTRVLNSLNFTN